MVGAQLLWNMIDRAECEYQERSARQLLKNMPHARTLGAHLADVAFPDEVATRSDNIL